MGPISLLTTTIIATWLEFPLTTVSRQQAWFVHAVLQAIGEEMLLLNEVWQAYTQLRKYVLATHKRRSEMLACMQELHEELSKHPLASTDSEEKKMLHALASLVRGACTGTLHYIPPSKSLEDAAALTPPSSDVDMETSAPNPRRDLSEAGSDESDEEDGDSQSNLLHTAASKIVDRFVDFLVESYALEGDVSNPNKFQQHLIERTDYLYPFRELAPSRRRAVQDDGPFTEQRARTDAGMFSALIHRGITFGTDFSFEYTMFFHDADEFNDVKSTATDNYRADHGCEPPEDFFCDSGAFGASNFRRTANLVEIYAGQLQKFSWKEKLGGQKQMPFLECWDWLRGDTDVQTEKRFPVLGPLAGYLLTADLSYVGVVIPPTLDDIATVIWDMNKGAVAGLEALHLITVRPKSAGGTRKRADKGEVKNAVKLLFKLLQQRLPKEMQRAVRFDLIVLEHSLCKFSRCLAKNWFQLKPGTSNLRVSSRQKRRPM
ncbi:hypothetical protein C8R44DRAFT_865450 [Mycena epipterygia]|nr:hypothetical protein C8R44DRAFT_865450 [Mycena epipterygia]